MPANPPENMPRITPNVFYDNPASALEWLSKAFGFETRMSMPGPDGGVIHAESMITSSTSMTMLAINATNRGANGSFART